MIDWEGCNLIHDFEENRSLIEGQRTTFSQWQDSDGYHFL
jgi:hypothetical protein